MLRVRRVTELLVAWAYSYSKMKGNSSSPIFLLLSFILSFFFSLSLFLSLFQHFAPLQHSFFTAT